jgi:hypothetical protein
LSIELCKPLARNIAASGGMTITAVCFVKLVTDVNGMDELGNRLARRDILLDLAENVMAKRAVLGNDPAFG